MKKPSREELLLRDEQLRDASKDIDEPFRHYFERGERITENRAAQRMFDDNYSDSADRKWGLLKSFLWCPARDLSDEELEFRIGLLEKKSMSAHYVSSFLRIIESGIWYDRSADYIREHIVSKWEGSSVKNSWAQTRKKVQEEVPEKKLKKLLGDGVPPPRGKNRGPRGKKRGT